MKNLVLKQESGIALIVRCNINEENDRVEKSSVEPFVVAVGYNEQEDDWKFGHYFSTLDKALNTFKDRVADGILF